MLRHDQVVIIDSAKRVTELLNALPVWQCSGKMGHNLKGICNRQNDQKFANVSEPFCDECKMEIFYNELSALQQKAKVMFLPV